MGPPKKKRKIAGTVPEKIECDFSAREEYVTDFHKRKVARQKFAQDEAAKREEEKLRFRKEVTSQLLVIDLERRQGSAELVLQFTMRLSL
ncbi:hypothetical protein SNOG_16212 [Parastagonospora nodorum SN15]|uniref:Nucleolar protein 12 n=2 Tax=Phaeosphaeria nodorum (strain SN15 / ATCC MYA-4574 / FGSC 10173) TaxID=321614 RepID=A0A7U2IDA4_PHANO|nr:hypothetical protein SNOG_16212 [Parastagonospora nodorum SN15]EAT76396.1 hypothetical protein SNOG_16212 [Parastagonospora nodorum SN15]QRD07736.1 hypothetical protein JI435_424780 [Parastagonospora nodorum SN15]